MPLGPFIGTRKVSNPPQLYALQDVPNNYFIVTKSLRKLLKKFLQNKPG